MKCFLCETLFTVKAPPQPKNDGKLPVLRKQI